LRSIELERLGLLAAASILVGAGCIAAVGNRAVESTPQIEPGEPGYRIEIVRLERGWDLLRFRPDTGQAWRSSGDRWIPIADTEEVPRSDYAFEPMVQGPNAWSVVRLDTRTGRSWVARDLLWVEIDD
jgi:hypothetical protein